MVQSPIVWAPATVAASSKPLVTLLVQHPGSGECQRLERELDGHFTCSVRSSEPQQLPGEPWDCQLVIWECAQASATRGMDPATALAGLSPACPVIAIADDLQAITSGLRGRSIADFLIRPYSPHELLLRARRVLGLEPCAHAGARPAAANVEACVIGHSAALVHEVSKLKRFAACDAGMLILGETGTGKEVFAQAAHYLSARAARPMVAINCGAVPAELMEAELFGHVKGAYTNAHISRTGLVREAQCGTLFLDDVDCLPLPAQAKLLRFLQEREYRVVGSNVVQRADVRVIAASNRDLAALARQGGFRQDLFYRLNVLTLSLPPLREHKDDIPVLSQHFLGQFAHRYGPPMARLSPAALLKLQAYDWPGNVRELGHVLERAALLCSGGRLDAADIDLSGAPAAAASCTVPTEDFQAMKARVVESFERNYIETILSSTKGNITEAARMAGKNRRALFELIRKHEITADTFRPTARR